MNVETAIPLQAPTVKIKELLLKSGYFDPIFYADRYVDIDAKKIDPLKHYLAFGWMENRQPSKKFDPEFYKSAYEDIPKDTNSLLHFFQFGIFEGRVGSMETLVGADLTKNQSPTVSYFHAKVFFKLGQWYRAEQCISNAISITPSKVEYFNLLSDVLKKQAKWWQRVECLTNATQLMPQNAELHLHLAETQEKMKNHPEAARAYKAAIALAPNQATWHYRLGYVLETKGHDDHVHLLESKKHYILAVKYDTELNSQKFGIGIFHQQVGRWTAAAAAYAKTLRTNYDNAELHFKLGMAYDRTYQWALARLSYRNAIALNPHDNYWHYRLGFVCERLRDYNEAADAYRYAAHTRSVHSVYWHYRCAYSLERAGRLAEACEEYLNTLKKDSIAQAFQKIITRVGAPPTIGNSLTSPLMHSAGYQASFNRSKLTSSTEISLELDCTEAETWRRVALEHAELNNIRSAIKHLKQAIARQEAHNPAWHYSLGCMLLKEGQLNEACEAFRNIRIMQGPYGAPEDPINNDKTFKKIAIYTEYYERETIDPSMVLYESFHGASMSCNPFAIFNKIIASEDFSHLIHIWVINEKAKIPKKFKKLQNVIFISRESEAYLYYISKAKYLINNNTFPPYFIRKEQQRYLNTWHGTPLKTLGKDIKTSLFEHKNAARNLLHATDIIVPNTHSEIILLGQHDIRHAATGNILRMGYPRIDLTINPSPESLIELQEELGLTKNTKVVFYAPTYRGSSTGAANRDIAEIEKAVKIIEQAIGRDSVVFFKGHHMIEKSVSENFPEINFLPEHVDTNQFLALTDVLITDYSSIAIDFITTSRPIIFYAYDYEQYKQERGLYFDLKELGGHLCLDENSLRNALKSGLVDKVHNQPLKEKFCPHDNGNSSDEIIDYLFREKSSARISAPAIRTKNILAFAGALIPNGITTSLTNLTNALDYEQYSFTLVIDAPSVANHPERVNQLNNLNPNVNILARVGRQNLTIEEKWLNDYFMREHSLPTEEMQTIFNKFYLRENIRVFGRSSYDCQINFDGYIRFWALVLAQKIFPTTKNIAYLHNDMIGEWTKRFPNLESIFNTYKSFDTLLSVSKATNMLNLQNLAAEFDIPQSKFDYSDNLIDVEKVISLAREDITDALEQNIFSGKDAVFVNVARLSIEKGHEDLIKGFELSLKYNSNIKLVIIGDGPLRYKLQDQINKQGLSSKIFLLGHKDNPFKYLKRSGCFIFSSKHEGQGLALLEAMILGLPIICTDFPCAYDVLESGRLGDIVGMAPTELAKGIHSYLSNKTQFPRFDHAHYQHSAINKFYDAVNG